MGGESGRGEWEGRVRGESERGVSVGGDVCMRGEWERRVGGESGRDVWMRRE